MVSVLVLLVLQAFTALLTLQTEVFKCFINKMPPKNKTAVVAPAAPEADADSDASDEMSDPEEDVAEDEAMAAVEFDTVRDAARIRVADRTRTQYDLFIGLMVVFFLSKPDLKHVVVNGQCELPLSITAVSNYLDYVESKRREYMPGKFKPVSPSYYRTVCRSIHDLYLCQQAAMDERLRLLMFSRTKTFVRMVAVIEGHRTLPLCPQQMHFSGGIHVFVQDPCQGYA